HRVLELLSRLVSVAGFGALALRAGSTSGSIFFGTLAFSPLIGMRAAWAAATAADGLPRGALPLPRRPAEPAEALTSGPDTPIPAAFGTSLAGRAMWLRQVIERAMDAESAPGIAGSIALMMAWVVSVVITFMTILALAKVR